MKFQIVQEFFVVGNCFNFASVYFAKEGFFLIFESFELVTGNRASEKMRHNMAVVFTIHMFFEIYLGIWYFAFIQKNSKCRCMESFCMTYYAVHIKYYRIFILHF